jgi:polyhydroxybutyrate depolymerase
MWRKGMMAMAMALAIPAGYAVEEMHTLTHGGVVREYLLEAPQDATQPLPLVIVLHGRGGEPASIARGTGFSKLARKEGFAVVYPAGTGQLERAAPLRTWNARHCCGQAMAEGVDDVGYISALIDELVARRIADPRRVYVTGMSNGGMLTHRVAMALGTKIAAAAPVAAGVFGDEPPAAAAVPMMIFNGADDDRVPPAEVEPSGRVSRFGDGTPYEPAVAQAAYWARANGCEAEPQHRQDSNGERWEYSCPAGQDVVRYLVANTGHEWPQEVRGGLRRKASGVDATAAMWTFFKGHSR